MSDVDNSESYAHASPQIILQAPPKVDGMKSRKFILTVSSLSTSWITATVALFIDKMDAGQWIGFNQWVLPMVLGIYAAGNVMERKVLSAKEG